MELSLPQVPRKLHIQSKNTFRDRSTFTCITVHCSKILRPFQVSKSLTAITVLLKVNVTYSVKQKLKQLVAFGTFQTNPDPDPEGLFC